MKLVINTQVRENYGAHEWDGEGECPQYWKFKGGHVYVVENLTISQVNKINKDGIPTLKSLIENHSDSYEEYVLGWNILDNDDAVGEPWETPVQLSFLDGQWKACHVVENGEYGYMRKEIARKIEAWDMLKNGERSNYQVIFILKEDGRAVDSASLSKLFAGSN